MAPVPWKWLLFICFGVCTAWMDERPVLESRDGNLFISAAKDRNITLKILGDGYVNVNEINLLHVATAAESATRLIERWKTGYLAEVENNLQRLTQIVEGPDGLERRVAMMKAFGEGNSTFQPGNEFRNQSSAGVNLKMRMLAHRIRRVEDKVKSMEQKLKVNECSSNPCLNGGTCQDLYEGYQCNCPSNWEGPNCVMDVNECVRLLGTDLGCQNGATCHNLPGSYRCDCAPGWFGLHCTKKTSICNTQNSEELCGHGVCVAKTGSPLGYTCICDQGWQSEGTNPACIKDVDECAGNHRPCSVNPWVECRNAPGTFFCDSCPRGYTGNGYYCTDIDECQVDNGGCSTSPRVQCINTMGSRMCGPCPTGYRGDGVTCVYVGSCSINNGGCHPLATCVENPALTSAYVICRCPSGMVGDGIGPNGCQSSTDIVDVRSCHSNPCIHGRCVPTTPVSGYTCICDPGFTGKTCESTMVTCSPNPCRNNGVCVISNGMVACDCPSTYTGSRCETPRQVCGGVSRNPVGHLEFPIGGNVYQHGLSCAWVLITNSSFVLNVTFTRFHLERSVDCKYDFLQIHDGRNAGNQMIGRFCGDDLPHTNGNIISSHNSLYFWFHSDSSVSHDGFAFQWNSIEPVCGGTLTSDYGTISSPGSPGRYPPNRDCYWEISVRPTMRIQIHFGQLMLEEHENCGADFLEITSLHDGRLGRYCNHTHPPPLVVPSSNAVVYFHSDSAVQDAGFQIHYSAIEGIPGCNAIYTASSGTINSPTNVDHYSELECEWKIQLPIDERVQLSWTNFNLFSDDCLMENIRIYDGDGRDSPLLERYCGSTIPPTIRSNSNVLLVVFKSNALQKGTFSLSYNTICGGVFTEESGIIHSPMYALQYQSTTTCTYEIKQPPNRRIVLRLLDADVRGIHTSHCFPSYFRIFDGPDENSTRLANICGADAVSAMDGMVYYSTYNYMLLKYSSIKFNGSRGRGFLANYTTVLTKCGGIYKEMSGSIQMPPEGRYYTPDEDCIWTMQAPVGYVVQLTWLSFDIEPDTRCRLDYVKVYEHFMVRDAELIGTFCGSKKPPILTSSGNVMTVRFHSDSTVNHEGFVATYHFLDESKVCGGHFTKPNGVLKSPHYPKKYPGPKECVWVIEARNRNRVILNIQRFELESHSRCLFDYLEIRNGGYDISPLIGKFCGTDIPAEIISQTNQLYLKFVSDKSRSYGGFLIEWDGTTTGCGGTLTAANGDIISPNYPQPYMQQADCYWNIAVAAGSLVRLLIVDLQLESHDRCRFDYIEISEGIDRQHRQIYCSSPYPKVIQAKSNIMNVRFRSDFTNSGRGFHLKYETLCHNTLRGFYGVIESPNFPDRYEHNLNCSWTINAPIGNKINLTFSHLDIERTPTSCEYDYLRIQEGEENIPGTQLAKLCMSDKVPRIQSSKHQVFLTFITDSMIAFNGFRVEWTVDGCGGHLTRPFDGFTSPGYPSSYPTNVDCEWLIEVDYGHSIELTIHDILTEKQKGCFMDKLQIYGGESDEAPKLVEICYSEKPLVYTSFGNKMFVKFHSDVSYSSRGFNATYKSVPVTCGGRYTTDTGVIFSPNYPQNYPNKQNCEWLLQVDQNYVVNVTFMDFDVEGTDNCTMDYVQIHDGSTRNSPLLGTFCGNELPPSFVSTSNEMLLVMRADSMMSAKGFKARYAKSCGARIIVKDHGYITPVGTYTGDMSESANCTWILVAENPADHVTVTFTHMEINLDNDWGDDCDWVSLQVFEGEGLDGPSQGKWCYNVVPLPITSSGNALTVHLYANYDFLGHFALTYSVLNSACGGTYTSSQGLIASPGYPNTYPLNAECIWILNNSPGNKLSLTFSTFDLQQSENCDLDYLEIRENSGIGKLITIACGTDIEPVQTSEKLWIKFKSDGDDVGKGFVGEYTITGGSELSGPSGRITSPLYPIPFKKRDTISWRITVDFGWMIQIEITDSFIENYVTGCFSYLRVYDGYDSDASILLETCGLNIPDPVTTTSNVAYVEMTIDALRQGSWFDLTWLRIPKNSDNFDIDSVKLNNCTQEVSLVGEGNNGYDFTSPGYPNGYDTYLRCTWLFTSPPGTHLVLRILSMDLEETIDCVADFVAVYSGNALTEPNNANLVQKLCLANATSTLVKAGNVMTVKFESDSYLNETGFSAYVYKDCGGKLEGPNGVIEINNSTTSRNVRSWQVLCEWVVEVRPGRTIEVIIEDMAIQQGPSWTCTDNYLMLKNGGEATSPLLGVGKYCGDVIPAPLETTGNRLYVKVSGIRSNVKFKLNYREVSMKCGGEFMLSSKQKKWEVNTPNYPNIPPPFSECMWTALAPNKERISLHFVERFDLSDTLNCEKEYVEVRDGGTESSKLLGKFCKNVAPSTMTSMGNVMYMRFYTDVSEPKNGFKAVFSIGEACGGIIRGTSGTISSPNYPFFYPKNVTCVWRVVAPTDHTLKFTFMDIQLPGFRRCRNTDHVQINEILPGNDTDINIGTYCALTLPDVVETASNQANVIFKSDNFEFTTYRGFNLQFVASQEVCGGEFTALQGIIKSNGYPNVATRSRYCDWLIKLPKGFQVVVEILDLDVIPMPEPRVGFSLSFYNDFRFRSRIIVVGPNSTQDRIKSSSNTMMIGYYSAAGYRGFKLRYYAAAPAPCGGILKEVKGNISGPTIPPFNQSSYFCQWSVEPPETLANNYNNTGLTLSLKASGVIGGIRSHAFNKYCFNYQYISLSGVGMICGNLSDPVYLRSPMKTNELIIVNGTYGKTMRFDLEYQWQPCGGILQGLSHVITAPKNISYPINCAWFVKYPDNGEMIRLHFNRLRLGGCDKNYITVRNGGPFSPEMGMFCGNYIPNNITSTSNQLWIEYMSSEEPNDFEFVLEPANNGCGGALRGSSREISSPKFPSQYPNNAECTWEITAENGYHIGLTFVDRFNLENSNNCEKDYVQIFDWVNEGTNGSYKKTWKSLGKVCGRNTPLPFNTTSNRMKVVFRSNEAIQGDGFRAIWNQNCGGIFEATSRAKIIQSPSYPDFYHPNSFCNYTLLAPKKDIIIEFTHFQLEQSRRDCRFDNVTIKTEDKYSSTTEGSWCGENKPPLTRSTERAEIIFKSDRYVQRTGFVFKYLTNDCGGTLTAPGEIKPIMNGVEYFGDTDCVWKIKAPSDKNVVLRFEEFQLEYGYGCSFDNIKVYDGLESKDENRLAMLCGDLTYNLPVIKSTSNSMLVEFFADSSRHFKGFSAKILFTKSVEAGCGGNINLTTAHSQQFKTQKGSMYESLEDCHWTVQAPLGKNIKLTINSIDVKNATNRTVIDSECTGDYLEVRDGIGPFSELLGKFCGSQPPVPILSGSNKLWIRFYSDGTLEGNGVSGTLETINALCPYAEPIVNDTKFILTSPNYPYSYGANARCRWTLTSTRLYDGKLRIRFLDFDLADSSMCESDFLQITDTSNRKYIEEGFGEDFVWTGNPQSAPYAVSHHMPSTSYKYCGNSLPHDYFSYNTEIELSFKGSTTGHRGFKIEYGAASCDRNYTSEQGRILHESVNDCWITITAPANYTVSIYFNQFMLYDPDECTRTSLQVYDGGFNGKLLASLCSMEVPSPIFSTGNKLSLHSWSEWHTTYEYYDITYTTTNAGRGCGGRLYNYAGSFTSPMYPNEYRENTECVWDITVPKGLKVFLEFTVFDIGTKNTCSENYNMVKIYDFTESGERMLMTTYCGGDNPAPFEANGNHVAVIYKSSLNNIGTGWMANFKAKAD